VELVPVTATKDQVAQDIVGEAKARNHTRDECLAEMSALYQESGWDETVWDPTHTTYGVAQQDGSYPNRFQGAAAQVKAFFDKLDVKRNSPGHGDIWLNICWMQQAPNWPSAQYWWDNGRQAYLTEIKSRISTVTPYLDKYWPTGEPVTTPASPVGAPPFTETDLTQNNNNCEDRAGYKPRLIILHTEEGGMQGSAFVDWMANNGVSYGYVVNPDGSVDDMETDDVASWSVLDPANEFSINICFATSSASWTRQQWLDNMSAGIKSAAYLAVRKCLAFNIPTQILVGKDYPRVVKENGITDHNAITVTQLSPGSTHTDVGPNFPWDTFGAFVAQYTPGAAPTPDPPADPLVQFNEWVAAATDRELLEYVTRQIGPGDPAWASKNKTLRDKVFGV
jgi:N-acetyl-anhydromuramyl-L-alanine amidase AmpD